MKRVCFRGFVVVPLLALAAGLAFVVIRSMMLQCPHCDHWQLSWTGICSNCGRAM